MKNIKIKIILSVIFLSVMGFVGIANAVGASLYVSPATLTKTAGDTFSASVGFTASGSKVCAVEGTLVFNNLTCQSVTVSGDADIMPMPPLPTCSSPHFLIGIQNCTTSDKILLTASVKSGSAGMASINITSVDIIGEGASVGSASISGNYTINAVPKPIPTPTPTQETTQTSDGFVGYVNGEIQTFPTMEAAQQAGATEIQANYQYLPSETTPTPESTQQDETPAEQIDQENSLPANIGTASLVSVGMRWYNYIVIALVILIILYSIYYFAIKRKKK